MSVGTVFKRTIPLFMKAKVKRIGALHTTTFYKRPLPQHLVAFSSKEGKTIFREALDAGFMESYFALAEQYSTQSEPACKHIRFVRNRFTINVKFVDLEHSAWS